MLTPEELIARMTGDEVVSTVSRHFNLTRDQTIAAIKALMPAYLTAMKNLTSAPGSRFDFFEQLAKTDFDRYFKDASQAFSQENIERGNAILGQLFGSREVSRAIADHATRISKLNAETMKRLLPALAPILMSGLGAADGGQQQAQQKEKGNPFTEFFEQMLRPSDQESRRQASGSDAPPFPGWYSDFFQSMQKAMQPDAPAPSDGKENTINFNQLQKDYLQGIESIFEQFGAGSRK